MDEILQDFRDRFSIPGLHFDVGNGGFIRAVIDSPVANGELYLHGAHVTRYQPQGHTPVLWMSEQSFFETGKPIRGGVPICFPWFGPNAQEPQALAHGLARTTGWDVVASGRLADGGVSIALAATVGSFSLGYEVQFGRLLQLTLSVELASSSGDSSENSTRTFEEALHTYLAIGDIRLVTIEGLESYSYLDKVGGAEKRSASRAPIRFSNETDRVYCNTNTQCTLRDPNLKRSIRVSQANSRSTIVWNPWIEKSARMPDFGDQEWPGMVCIETANVGDHKITIESGQIHTMVTRIDVAHDS